jgi:hypothetical protein
MGNTRPHLNLEIFEKVVNFAQFSIRRGDILSPLSQANSKFRAEMVTVTRFPFSRRFPRRHNPHGTIDSICPECFATVATEKNEADLEAHEKAHVPLCNGLNLEIMYHSDNREPSRRSLLSAIIARS